MVVVGWGGVTCLRLRLLCTHWHTYLAAAQLISADGRMCMSCLSVCPPQAANAWGQ